MTFNAILNPIPIFPDAKGVPITGGSIYIGTAGLDPETNPQAIYWDAAGATPASQPLQVKGGFVVNGTTPAQFFTASPFSIRVYDAFGAVVYYKSSISAADASAFTGAGGAALIGAATGGTVEDAIWHKGRTTPIAGSKAQVNWIRDDVTYPLENEAAIWVGKVVVNHGVAATFVAGDGQAGSPCAGLFVTANNNGSPGDVCGVILEGVARVNSSSVFGANIIARTPGAQTGVKLVGLEIDVEYGASATSAAGSGGLFINGFSVAVNGPAIQTGGVSSGTFANGIILGGLAATGTGVALSNTATANSLINTTVGTFGGAAITMGSGASRGMLWQVTSKNASMYHDGSNMRTLLPGSSGSWVFRDSADTISLAAFQNAGGQGVLDLQTTSGEYRVNGTRVLGARITGWGAATNGSRVAFNGSTATLAQTSAALAALIIDLTAQGVIGA